MSKLALIVLVVSLMFAVPVAGHADEVACGPSNEWSRACAPAAMGTALFEGTVTVAPGFDDSAVAVMYRTTEGSEGPRVGLPEYGPWQTAGVAWALRTKGENGNGVLRLTVPACSPEAEFGCIGTAYELYAAYRGEPCTEMWYAKPYVNEPYHLPLEALICDHVSAAIAPLTGGSFEPALCKPLWARNCLPGPVAATSVGGAISHPPADHPFSMRHVAVAYRTVERGHLDESIYGAVHEIKATGRGKFSISVPTCGAIARATFGCDGEDIEVWPTYDHVRCGSMQEGWKAGWGVACDTRGTIEGELLAPNANSWHVVFNRGKRTVEVAVKRDGAFLAELMPASYRIAVHLGRKECVVRKPVVLTIASKRRLRLHC